LILQNHRCQGHASFRLRALAILVREEKGHAD
jgi:hypothetical protein